MELTLWTYEGPPHVGAMRIAASMQGVHYVLHAPQGDTYADLLFTMIERRDQRPPVTYTTFQARDLGGDTAELVKRSIRDAAERFQPQALLVGESCTAELIQDQPGALAQGMNLPMPVVTLELKNPLSGQTAANAIHQYRHDRDPREPVFLFTKRTLVHFAVDTEEAYMTTRLAGTSTHFLPFNKGRDGGAGEKRVFRRTSTDAAACRAAPDGFSGRGLCRSLSRPAPVFP